MTTNKKMAVSGPMGTSSNPDHDMNVREQIGVDALLPIIQRALDTGRGSPGLLVWLSERIGTNSREQGMSAADEEGSILRRLVKELVGVVQSRSNCPLAEEVWQTLRSEETWIQDR